MPEWGMVDCVMLVDYASHRLWRKSGETKCSPLRIEDLCMMRKDGVRLQALPRPLLWLVNLTRWHDTSR